MKNTLFVQFYKQKMSWLFLMNGFSDTYSYCKNKGDFIWVDVDNPSTLEIPFSKGTVHATCIDFEHAAIIYNWAKRRPKVHFIVGGPCSFFINGIDYEKLRNFEVYTGSVEEYFNIANFSMKWKLNLRDLPKHLKYESIYFSYTLGQNCSWKKCNFCSSYHNNTRIRESFRLRDILNIPFDGTKQVALNTTGPSADNLLSIIPELRYDKNIIYELYFRSNKTAYMAMDEELAKFTNVPQMKVKCGIEYPVDRMLKYVNKGISSNDILRSMKMFSKYKNILTYGLFIVGWPNLTIEDLVELKRFRDRVPKFHQIHLHTLMCLHNTKIFNEYINDIDRLIKVGPFERGYYPNLSDSAKHLNLRSRDIIKSMTDRFFENM